MVVMVVIQMGGGGVDVCRADNASTDDTTYYPQP